jgi:hypothetical protein
VAYQSSAVVVMSAAPVEETLLALLLATEMVFLILNDHRPRQTTIGTRTGQGQGITHLDKIKDDLRSQDPGLSRARVGMDSIVVYSVLYRF